MLHSLFRPLWKIVRVLSRMPEWQAEEVLRSTVWWAILACLLVGLLGSYELRALAETRKQVEVEMTDWVRAMEASFPTRQLRAARFQPVSNKKAIVAMREGPNGTQAWLVRLEGHTKETLASFSDLKERITRGLSMVRRGWWEAEQHFRLFHTHDRGSSPLIRMNLPISITTRGTNWRSLDEMLLIRSLLPSILFTMEEGYQYGVYVGYDAGDPLLDKPGAEAELHRLWNEICRRQGRSVELKLFKYNDTRNYNVWAVNYITKEAYLDGYDYFFRVNDDSEFRGQGWTSRLVEALQLNEDFGAAGVLDEANPRIWTHSIVGRPHVEIFGFHFPFSFGNWWSDDWITFAYSRRFSLWLYDVDIFHHRHNARYSVDWTDYEKRLSTELERSQVRWKQWLCRTRDLAEFCGPEDARKEAQLSEVRMATRVIPGLARDALLAMETKALKEQFVRMARFPPARKNK